MEAVFLRVLNMSLTAGYVIIAVLLLRLLLRRAPKKYSYLLWSVVGFRLLCPVSFPSVVSLFNVLSLPDQTAGNVINYIPENIGVLSSAVFVSGGPVANGSISSVLPPPTPTASADPLQILTFAGAVLWLLGAGLLLLYAALTLWRVHRQVRTAVRMENGVWACDAIRSPFILGLFHPKIYLPFGLEEGERDYVLAHERYHLRRKDHWVKMLSFLLLALHWFNPLVWVAFACMARDMEMSCDEHVLAEGGAGLKRAYSTSLLSFAANNRPKPPTSPLAFGETAVKARIRNVLRYRPARKWVVVTAALLCLALAAACVSNPVAEQGRGDDGGKTAPAENAAEEAATRLTQLFADGAPSIWYRDPSGDSRSFLLSDTEPGRGPDGEDLYLSIFKSLFNDCEWERVDGPVTPAGNAICLGQDAGHCFLFHLGTEYVTLVSGDTRVSYRTPWSTEDVFGSNLPDYVLRVYSQYEVEIGVSVPAVEGETFEEAADRWLAAYREQLLNVIPESTYALTDMAVVEREISLTREGDDSIFGFWLTMAVKPVEPYASPWWAGNTGDGEGAWEGWMVMYQERLLERIDGAWYCTGSGTGGLSLDP